MEFLVADAERLFAEGGKVKNLSFWGYKIMTRSTLAAFQAPPLFPKRTPEPPTNFIAGDGYTDFCTWHRYSDFEWLVEQLEYAFPGVVFPPIPDKDADGTKDKISDLISSKDDTDTSRDNEFVQKRIRHLQLFFDFLVPLTMIHECEVMKAFVTMEEAEWLVYKDRKQQEIKPHGWDLIKSKGLGFLSKIGSLGDKKPVAFPDGSVIAAIRSQQQALGDCMRAASMHMTFLKKYGHFTPDIRTDIAVEAAQQQSTVMLPSVLVYNGHFVCDVNDRRRQGVVRHVEGNSAWVDWGNAGEPLSRVPVHQLCYPASGVSDPTVFACNEIANQVDSFCAYLSLRPESRQLERLTDLLYFWSKFAQRVVRVSEGLQQLLETLVIVEKDASKKKDGPDKVELTTRATQMRHRFESGCTSLIASHANLRVNQRKVLLDVAFLFGNLSVNFLSDDEWDTRLQRADAALPLLFEPPQEVIDTLTQEAKAAHFVADYLPQAAAAPQPPVPPVSPPAQYPAAAPSPTDEHRPSQQQNFSPAYSNAEPQQPTQRQFRAESYPPMVPTAPPEDDTPPPLPAATPSEATAAAAQPETIGVEIDWKPRSSSRHFAEPERDGLEPPPPPA